jgi:hypothetical protein
VRNDILKINIELAGFAAVFDREANFISWKRIYDLMLDSSPLEIACLKYIRMMGIYFHSGWGFLGRTG